VHNQIVGTVTMLNTLCYTGRNQDESLSSARVCEMIPFKVMTVI